MPQAVPFLQGCLGLVLRHLSAHHLGHLRPPVLFSLCTSDTAVAGDLPSKHGRRKRVGYTKKKGTDFLKCSDENCLSVLRLPPPPRHPFMCVHFHQSCCESPSSPWQVCDSSGGKKALQKQGCSAGKF